MTIAAGIQFNGGVLLCADSQFSSPSIKFFDTKLSQMESNSMDEQERINTVVAMSGTDGYMQTVVTKIEDALSAAFMDRSAEEWVFVRETEVIESALIEVYKNHIYPHPRYGYTDGPHVELLIGISHGYSNATVYRTSETAVNELSFLDPFVFIGSGSDVARYAVSPLVDSQKFSREGLLLDEAVLLATHALRVAKQNDIYCGGQSEFAVLYDDGTTGGVAQSAVDVTERYSETFEGVLRRLFYSVADIESDRTADAIRLSNLQIKRIRSEQKKLIRERRRIADLLKPQREPREAK